MSEALTEELSPKTAAVHIPTLASAPVSQYREEEEEEEDIPDDMPMIYFKWEDETLAVFFERWAAKKSQIRGLNPALKLPTSVQNLYFVLLEEFERDIEGASIVGKACIQCVSSFAYGFVHSRMTTFELQPWVKTSNGRDLPESAKLAILFMSATVHKMKPLKLECKLWCWSTVWPDLSI